MKKYSMYEIEKLTKGQLSKYKVKLAIDNGELKAEKIKQEKKGRGSPSYLVKESDLMSYIAQLNDDHKEKEKFNIKINKTLPETNSDTGLDNTFKKSIVDELKNRIINIEKEMKKEKEVHQKQELLRSKERQKLLIELSNTSVFSVKKRKLIINKLNEIV